MGNPWKPMENMTPPFLFKYNKSLENKEND